MSDPSTPQRIQREEAALRVDPWGDGKGDDYYVVFRNQMVTTRKPSTCVICIDDIPVGSRVRAQTEQYDGKVMTFRFCPRCVEAMASYGLDDKIDALSRRYERGRKQADRKRKEAAHV